MCLVPIKEGPLKASIHDLTKCGCLSKIWSWSWPMELEYPMCRGISWNTLALPLPSPPSPPYFLFYYIGKVSYIHFRLQKAYMTWWWYYGVSNGCKKGFWVHLVTQQSSSMRSLNCKSKRWDKLTDIFFPKDSCMHALALPPHIMHIWACS